SSQGTSHSVNCDDLAERLQTVAAGYRESGFVQLTQSDRPRWEVCLSRNSPVTVRATVQDDGRGVPNPERSHVGSSVNGLLLRHSEIAARRNSEHWRLVQALGA